MLHYTNDDMYELRVLSLSGIEKTSYLVNF